MGQTALPPVPQWLPTTVTLKLADCECHGLATHPADISQLLALAVGNYQESKH
jgi:hypothetical protein